MIEISPVAQTVPSSPCVSPSVLSILESCPLRVAYDRDASFSSLRRLRPGPALGIAFHSVLDEVRSPDFSASSEEVRRAAAKRAWEEKINELYARFKADWAEATVPPPQNWPNYSRVRFAALNAVLTGEPKRDSEGPVPGQTSHKFLREVWLEDAAGLIVGRADRVEFTEKGIRIIDYKTTNITGEDGEIRPEYKRQLQIYCFLWSVQRKEWPASAAVQDLLGRTVEVPVDRHEAQAIAESAVSSLRTYNAQVGKEVPPESLARPSSETCNHCPYKGACAAFQDAIDESWGWYKKCLSGAIQDQTATSSGYIYVRVERGNLNPTISTARLYLGESANYLPNGARLTIIDALPTASKGHLKSNWETQIYEG